MYSVYFFIINMNMSKCIKHYAPSGFHKLGFMKEYISYMKR